MRPTTALTTLVAMLASLLLLAATPPQHANSGFTRVIVTFDDDVLPGPAAAALERRFGGEVAFVYEHVLNGTAIDVPARAVDALSNAPGVRRVEPDGVVTTMGEVETQTRATWGLDRIDQRALSLDDTYTYSASGIGVTAYVIDTGILAIHDDFGGRVEAGFDAIDEGGTGTTDCNGHGTHVASTLGGTTYGVAKDVTLVPVRVLDCNGSGTWSGVIAGMDWVAAQQEADAHPAVANMSLGGGASTTVDAAVRRMDEAGVTTVVAAGNGNRGGKEQDACDYSPAREPKAYTVGATTQTDAKTSWSNYGDCVDIFAPGAGITAAWYTSDTETNTISGTSMAAPHVAGVAALVLEGAPTIPPAQVKAAITDASTRNIVTNSRTANNHLLYSLGTGSDGPTTDPVADVAIRITAPSSGEQIPPSATPTTVTVELSEGGGADTGSFSVSLAITDSSGTVVATETEQTTLATSRTSTIEFEWATEALVEDDYTITASHAHVNPADGAASTVEIGVSLVAPDGGGGLTAPHVQSLLVDTRTTGPWERAEAVVTVTNGDGGPPLANVVVEGSWNVADEDPGIPATCTTDQVGVCTLSYQERDTPAVSLVITTVDRVKPTGSADWQRS